MIKRIDTRNMSREDWLAVRRSAGIGGSEAGIVLGLNRYRSRYSLWLEKTGEVIPDDISDREAVRLGNDLEDYVAKRWEEKSGMRVHRVNAILQNEKYPFAFANPDRMVVGENAGLECKTTSSYDVLDQCKNGFPECYYAQCVHYMMVTGAERWHLAVLVFGRGFFDFTLERDEAEIAALASAEAEFWQSVKEHNPPEIDGTESTTEALNDLYDAEEPGKSIDLYPVRTHLMIIAELEKQQKQITEQIDEHKNAIREYMGDAETGETDGFKVTWKTRTTERFNRKKWESDYPSLKCAYMDTNTTRMFLIKNKK